MEAGKLLKAIIPKKRIKDRLIDVVAYASDAGFYYLLPKAVVQPLNEKEIISLFAFSHQHKIPLTFRTGGTSLSGQAITDGILVDLTKYWDKIIVHEEGKCVRVQPGITGAMTNTYLKKFNRKIGPDPSSIDAAMIGGILSNNSSGMCCGVRFNSYHTTKHIRFILPNGKGFSTENEQDYREFEMECAEICQSILGLKQKVMSNKELHDLIRKKYKTKNTVGYSLNAFVDYSHPMDILAHLLIGAEGTLGFIAEAVMETIPDYPHKATALLYFKNVYDACQALMHLTVSGAEAIELMDRASLTSIENISGTPARLKSLPPTAAALLVEYQGNTKEEVWSKINSFLPFVSELSILDNFQFTEDPSERAFLWKLRKGLFPAVGALRASGTTVILEDIAFPLEQLGNAISDLQVLFKKHGYDQAIIFGHAKDGNIHFVVTQSFNADSEIQRYDRFLQDVVILVVQKYDGTLKAEHGTGRNMAPFVETEWGSEAYAIMRALKKAIDPQNLLNPGVIINEDKNAHIHNLKDMPVVEAEVDKCIECGFCEHKCPSRNLSLTPRQRIAIRRKLEILKKEGNKKDYNQLVREYQYAGLDTCAVDGLCATACPVDINTGELVKRLRRESHNAFSNKLALLAAKNFGSLTALLRFGVATGISINKVFGEKAMTKLTGSIRKILPKFPLWSEQIRAKGFKKNTVSNIPNLKTGNPHVIYFPSCISRMMGASTDGKKNIVSTFINVSEKAGIGVIIPENIQGMCCGQLFSSKGFGKAFSYTANNAIRRLWEVSNEGVTPVVLDVTSCTHTLQYCRPVLTDENKKKFDRLSILDSIDYLHDHVMSRINIVSKKENIVLHPVCSLQKMKLEKRFNDVAGHFAQQVTVPVHAGCCGMAGDRGFLFPELTASATAFEAREVKGGSYDGYYSTAKTCEIAMSEAVGKNYESILFLVDECTNHVSDV